MSKSFLKLILSFDKHCMSTPPIITDISVAGKVSLFFILSKLGGKIMKNHLKSIIAVDVLGVLLARATLVHMNPIAVGFYGAALMIKQGRVFTFLAICLGLFSAMPIEIFSRYVVLMLLSGITIAILGKKTQKLKGIVVGGCMLGITLLTNLSSMFFYPKSSQGLEFCILEAIIVFVFVPLFYKGIEWMEKGKINFLPDNEEIVSIAQIINFIMKCF